MIRIENLAFAYQHKPVLEHIHLHLETGKIYGLLGKNGVGKTTLLKLMSGLLRKDEGSLQVNGYDPIRREPGFLSSLFFLPEEFSVPRMRVRDFVKNNGKFYPNFDYARFERLVADLETDPDCLFHKLSLGQRKKAMIAYALSLNTPLLLMDEPSNGLDIPSKSALRRAIAGSVSEERTFIISTHQVRDMENLIDPILILDNDGILMNASIEEIAAKLSFTLDLKPREGAVFTETVPGGCVNVSLNRSENESAVNIETLFEAALANRDLFKTVFNNGNNQK